MGFSTLMKCGAFGFAADDSALAGDSAARIISAERRAPSAERRAPSAERRAPSAERRAPSAERRAPSAERRAPSAERRAPSAEAMTAAGASGAEEPREPSARPSGAGLSNPFRFLFAARRLPRFGVWGGQAAALALLALAVLAPVGPAQAQDAVPGLTVQAVGDTTLRVSWTAVTGATRYVVGHKSSEPLALNTNIPTTSTSYDITGLAGPDDHLTGPGNSQYYKDYRVRVSAYASSTLIARSEVTASTGWRSNGTVVTAMRVPDVTVTNRGSTSVRVSWPPVGGASYDAVRYKSGSQSYSLLRIGTTVRGYDGNHYADLNGLTPGVEYTARVRASVDGRMVGQTEVTFTMGGSRNEELARGQGGPRQENRRPVFERAPTAQTATEGKAFAYTVPAATDYENNAIFYTAGLSDGSGLPDWLAFDPSTHTFSGTPGADDAPAELSIGVTATDNGVPPLSWTATFALTVKEAGAVGDGAPQQQHAPPHRGTPPTADAGADLTGKRGGDVTLSGSGALNAGGSQDALTYSWRIVGASHRELAAGTSRLTDADKATATYSVPRRRDVTDRSAVDNGQAIDFELTVTDGDGESVTDTVRMTIKGSTWKTAEDTPADSAPANGAPTFAEEAAAQTATEDEAFSYTAPAATDPDNDAITYTAALSGDSDLPDWLSFNASTRTFSGTPGADDASAALDIVVTATDDGSPALSDTTNFTLTVAAAGAVGDSGPQQSQVEAPNRVPSFTQAPVPQTATQGKAFSYQVPEASDPDGDTLTYSAALAKGDDLPDWLSFNRATRTFSGTPGADDAPAKLSIALTATDDGQPPKSASTPFTLTVEAPTPPVANAGADLEGKRGGEVTLSGSGTLNAEGSQAALSYSWRIADASHAELKSGTSWLTGADQASATYSVPRRKDMTNRSAVDDGQSVTFELTVTDGDGETATDRVTMTIRGSTWKVVNLSVADATAEESSGSIAFAVSLSAASRDPVSVDYATSNGTAVAGTDYTATSGTLTFQPGKTSKTVTVPIIDDVHDEATETFTLTLSNPSPAKTTKLADATATGSISNADPLQQDWLARFGRAAASDAIAAITARLETPRSAGSHLTVGGHRLPFGTSGNVAGAPNLPPVSAGGPSWLSWSGDADRGPSGDPSRTMSEREMLMGLSFRAVLGNGAGSQWTGWGQGASVSRFSSGTPGLSLSGETVTGSMGMDYERGRLLTGFAMTHSLGEGTAHGAGRSYVMGSSVTTVLPYARLQVSERVSAWGLAGTGSGRLTLDLDGGAAERYGTDLSMTLAAMGVRGELLTPAEAGGFALALKADAFWVRTESERVSTPGVGNLAGAQADASRMRAVLDGSRTFMLAGGATLTPSVELGVRHDGGDAETGTGMELGAGVGYADPSRGLDMALRVHGLAAHAEDGYSDLSVSGSLRFVPGGAGRGLSMSLTPAYGADPGGSERLWMQPDAAGLAANDDAEPSSRLDAEVGYGMAMFGGGFTGTPNVGLGLSETAREVRMGWRLSPAGTGYGGLEFSLDAVRREAANEDTPEHRIGFGITARW